MNEEKMSVFQTGARAAQHELTVEADLFKDSMRHLAGAVSVVTVGRGNDRTGFTATSVSSLAIDPPSVIVSLNRDSSSWPVLQRHGSFCVNVLAHDQRHVADSFAGRGGRKGIDRYLDAEWQELATGTLALKNALTVLDCELDDAIERHSHGILIGRVRAVTLRRNAEPLLYWHGATVDCLHHIRELRLQGVPVFFTVDAGPQVKAVCLPEVEEKVASALAAIPGVIATHTVGLGEGARVIDS